MQIIPIVDCLLTSSSTALGFVIIAVYIYDKDLRKLPSNAFLISFVATNFLVSTAGFLMTFYSKPTDFEQEPVKFLLNSSYIIFSMVSYALSLTVVTLDRYCAIVAPLRYSATMSRRTANKFVISFWFGITVLASQ